MAILIRDDIDLGILIQQILAGDDHPVVRQDPEMPAFLGVNPDIT